MTTRIPELQSLEISKSRGETRLTKLADDKQCLFTNVMISKGGDGELGCEFTIKPAKSLL